MSGVRELDFTTKIIVIILVVVISYFLLFSVLSVIFPQEPFSPEDMMNNHNMMGTDQNSIFVNLAAITVALLAGVIVSLLLMAKKTETGVSTKTDELDIIKRALSDDEKAVLDEIRRAGEITQDSLRFRLEWSKAKLSRILTHLDKLNLIQRERIGKTYNVFLTGKKPEE